MNKNIDLYKIIIASYLHDLGKLMRRWWQNRNLNSKTKNWFNPYQIAHAQQVFEFMLDNDFNDLWKQIWLIASLHHARDWKNYNFENDNTKNLAWIVYMADNISSNERIDRIDETATDKQYENIKHIWLTSIFENIFKDTKTNKAKYTYLPKSLWELNIKSFFPTDKGRSFEDAYLQNLMKNIWNTDISDWFKKLNENCQKDLKNLISESNLNNDSSDKEFKEFIYKLELLLQNYFTMVPSDAYKSIWDISLYDHTKTVVAIANVLYKSKFVYQDFKYEKENTDTDKVFEKKVKLIAWDFPSIQKYIFDWIKNQSKLSKRLRARSFKVQMLTEAVIHYIINKLDLSPANVLINAGGKFIILADQKISIKDIANEINNYFILNYNTDLKINLIEKEVLLKNIFKIKNNINNTFKELFDDLSQNKTSIYSVSNLQKIFSYQKVSWKVLCKHCWINYTNSDDENDYDNSICLHCQKEIEIGEKLVKNNCIYLNFIENDKFVFDLDFEWKWSLKVLFNDWNIDKSEKNKLLIWKSINLYVPIQWDEVKTFDKLASKNRSYLTMICGDIDNMSIILSHWFKDIYSVSRLVQFSRFMELFFGKFTQELLQNTFPDVYTVFSGWDDFIFVLPFKDRLNFADIYQDCFKKFIANNDKLHFSLWISIFKNKTPFKRVYEDTENLLKSAKQDYKSNLNNKNIIEEEKLSYRWVCIYQDNMKISDINEIKLTNIIKNNWEWLESTGQYRIYNHLWEIRNFFESQNSKNPEELYKIVHLWAKIIYSINKNVKENYNAKLMIENIKKVIWQIDKNSFDNWFKYNIKEIDKLLMNMTNQIYENREI